MAGVVTTSGDVAAGASDLPDVVGALTLERMATLSDYNRWLHDRFDPYLGARVLEIGSGIGNQTRYFADRERVVASDTNAHYVDVLRRTFADRPNVRVASFRFPLSADDVADLRRERLDSIVCLNVLEHIEDDRATLLDCASILPSGGRLVLLVPSHPALYGSLDIHLQHFRRYRRDPLRAMLSEAGFDVEMIRFVNRIAVFGWWLSSRVLRRRVLPRGQLAAFRWMMPLLKLEERRPPSFGLSLLAIGRRR
jgi:SAM-dependent methyltransferase